VQSDAAIGCKVCVSQRLKINLAIIVDQALQFKLEATPARTHGEAAGWGLLTLSDRFYTPTLIRHILWPVCQKSRLILP